MLTFFIGFTTCAAVGLIVEIVDNRNNRMSIKGITNNNVVTFRPRKKVK